MNRIIIDGVNELIKKCKDNEPDDNEVGDNVPYLYSWDLLNHEYYAILMSEAKLFESMAEYLWKLEKSFEDTVSRNVIRGMLQDFIYDMKKTGQFATKENLKKTFIQSLIELPIQKMEVIHGISGLKIESKEPVRIGNFRFYNYKKHQKFILPRVMVSGIREKVENETTLVSVVVEAREEVCAREKAIEIFEHLENTFRYAVLIYGTAVDIGIFDYDARKTDDFLIRTDEYSISGYSRTSGAMLTISLSSVISHCHECGVELCELLEYIGCNAKVSPMYERIIRAVDLLGRSARDSDKSIGFLEAMMAIEALLQADTNNLVNHSISAQISDYCAFVLEKECEQRIEIVKTMKKLYGIRSGLAHGDKIYVESKEVELVQSICKRLIDVFLSDESLRAIKNKDELRKYFEKLKYS